MHIFNDLFYTFVLWLGLACGVSGLLGGFSLGRGGRGALASAGAFLTGGVVAGVAVWLSAWLSLRAAPTAGVLFLPCAAAIGGYRLGAYLEAQNATDLP